MAGLGWEPGALTSELLLSTYSPRTDCPKPALGSSESDIQQMLTANYGRKEGPLTNRTIQFLERKASF